VWTSPGDLFWRRIREGVKAQTRAGRSKRKFIPAKTRHQKVASETRGRNGASVAQFPTRRPSRIPENAAVARGFEGPWHVGRWRPDWLAGVGGLELGNVPLQKAWPNSLVFQNHRDGTGWLGRQDSKLRIPESNSLGAPEDGVAPLRQTPRVGPLMSWLTPAYQPFRKPWGSTRSFEMQSFESCRPSHPVRSQPAHSHGIGQTAPHCGISQV
jgi:hypothetical protein